MKVITPRVLTALLVTGVNLGWIAWTVRKADRHRSETQDLKNRLSGTVHGINLSRKHREMEWQTDGSAPAEQVRLRLFRARREIAEHSAVGRNYLVLVLSSRQCSACVDQLLFQVRQTIPAEYADCLLVLRWGADLPVAVWEQRERMLGRGAFIDLGDRGTGLAADSTDLPYFFIWNDGSGIFSTHIHQPGREDLTDTYLRLVAANCATITNKFQTK